MPDYHDHQINWHQKTWVRIVILLLLPFVIGGLYLVTTRISLNKPASESIEDEVSMGDETYLY